MRRIIKAAGRRFKWDGIDGSGICTLMKDAGPTKGTFYTHYAIDVGSGGGDQWHPEGTERPMLKPLIRADAEQRMGGAVQNPARTAADSSR